MENKQYVEPPLLTEVTVFINPNDPTFGTVNGTSSIQVTCHFNDVLIVTASGISPYGFNYWMNGDNYEPLSYTEDVYNSTLQIRFTKDVMNDIYTNFGGELYVYAVFAAPDVHVSAVAVPAEAGSFTGVGNYSYNTQANVIVYNTDEEHYHFDGWSWSADPNEPKVYGGTYFSFTATEDVVAYAHFSLI